MPFENQTILKLSPVLDILASKIQTFVWLLDAIQQPDHLPIRQFSTIWKPDLSDFQMFTVLNCFGHPLMIFLCVKSRCLTLRVAWSSLIYSKYNLVQKYFAFNAYSYNLNTNCSKSGLSNFNYLNGQVTCLCVHLGPVFKQWVEIRTMLTTENKFVPL